jgi:hypothetical protein
VAVKGTDGVVKPVAPLRDLEDLFDTSLNLLADTLQTISQGTALGGSDELTEAALSGLRCADVTSPGLANCERIDPSRVDT